MYSDEKLEMTFVVLYSERLYSESYTISTPWAAKGGGWGRYPISRADFSQFHASRMPSRKFHGSQISQTEKICIGFYSTQIYIHCVTLMNKCQISRHRIWSFNAAVYIEGLYS